MAKRDPKNRDECRDQLHEALGLAPGDDFTWQQLIDIVRRDLDMVLAIKNVVRNHESAH